MVVTVIEKKDDKVKVDSAYGTFVGIWSSNNHPEILKECDLEVDSDTLVTDENISISYFSEPKIEQCEQSTNVIGLVEEIQDSILVLRVDKDLIMLNISSETELSKFKGSFVKVALTDIKMYDTGLL